MIRDRGAHAVAALLHERIGGELPTIQSRVRGWVLQDSIPGEYWQVLVDLDVGSLDEFAAAAEARRAAKAAPQGAAA
jgi:hypothetical protein